MLTVTAAGGGSYKQPLWKTAERKTEAAAPARAQAKGAATREAPAAVEIASGGVRAGEETDWLEALYGYLDELEAQNPSVHCNLWTSQNDLDLRGAAAALGPGMHLLLSPQFLLQMATGREAFEAGKAVLEEALARLYKDAPQDGAHEASGIYIGENGQAEAWTARFSGKTQKNNPFWSYLNKGGQTKTYWDGKCYVTEIQTPEGMVRFSRRKTYKYYAGKDLARLARLKKVSSVHSFVSCVQAVINQVRADKDLDEEEARVAIAKMKGVIVRARIKIRNLQEEDTLETRSKRRAQQAELQRARALQRELRLRRQLRQLREKMQAAQEPFVPPELLRRQSEARSDAAPGSSAAFANDAATVAPVSAESVAPAAEGSVAAVESVNILA